MACRLATKSKNDETASCSLKQKLLKASNAVKLNLVFSRLAVTWSDFTMARGFFLEQSAGLGPNVEFYQSSFLFKCKGRVHIEMNKYFSFLLNRPHNKYLLTLHSLDVIIMCSLSNLMFSLCLRQGLPCFLYPLVVQSHRGLL